MNDIQILKEIAYYSRYIHDFHRRNHSSYNHNKIVKSNQKVPVSSNKYKYIKKEVPSVIKTVQNISSKVLINPNFKLNVHVNPHFTAKNLKIHVNPRILNNKNFTSPPDTNNEIKPNSSTSLETNNKNIRSLLESGPKPRKRLTSIRSKYKIVKSSANNSKNICASTPVKNKYKIDRRNTSLINKSLTKKLRVRQGISDLARNNLFQNKIWRNKNILNHFKETNNKLTNINGVMYKQSKNKLQKINTNDDIKPNVKQRKRLISIKGRKYVMSDNRKTLKLISNAANTSKNISIRKVSVKGVTYVQKSFNKFVRFNTSVSLRKLKHKSAKAQVNKLRKNNQPCPVYRRFGTCRRKELGRCQFLHNPDQIFLCKKFLQGACLDNGCLLSHKVSLEKMPTCKYFLEGCCIRVDCPYLHVKISPKADICKRFLEGYCSDGIKCNKRHQYLCPDFERDNKCPRRKCRYPHKSKFDKEKGKEKIVTQSAIVNTETLKDESSETEDNAEVLRYYIDTKGNCSYEGTDNVGGQVSVNNQLNIEINHEICRRPKLGVLPSFIPLL